MTTNGSPSRIALAENLQDLMINEDVSKSRLAEKTGLPPEIISKLLNHENDVAIDKLEVIAEYFNLELWQLITPRRSASLP